MALKVTRIKDKTPREQVLRISKNDRHINIEGLSIFTYRDRDTRQIIMYAPSLEISGYGSTEDKGEKMLHFSLQEYFKYLMYLTPKKIDAALFALGWHQNKLKHKEYSSAFVDKNGALSNFNADPDQVELSALTL